MAETGFLTPDSYFGNSNQDVAQAIAIAQVVAVEAIEENWQVLRKTQAITLTSATSYALPTDYLGYIGGTAYQHGRWDPIDLPATDQLWNLLQSVASVAILPIRARIIANRLNIINPQAAAVVNIEYASNAPITDSTGVTPKTLFSADSDLWLLDDRMFQCEFKWRWKQEKGLEWNSALQEASVRRAGVRGRDTANSTIVPGQLTQVGTPYTNLWVP